MFVSARSRVCAISPLGVRQLSPSIFSQGRPSATSLHVRSNSRRVTKSIAFDARSDGSGKTATCGPTKPMASFGFASFIASAVFTSARKDGVLVWMKHSSKSFDLEITVSNGTSAAGASMSVLSGTSAAGWASHVGYQDERTSRRAWYRDPAPPSNPSKDGGLRNNVFFIADRPPGSRLAGRRGEGHPSDAGTIER